MSTSVLRNNPSGPLVLTLTVDPKTSAFLTSLRSRHFPSRLNHLRSHVTLFHAIPPHRMDSLAEELDRVCAREASWDVFVGEPRKMGKGGVMLTVRERPGGSSQRVRRALQLWLCDTATRKEDELTDQDMRRWFSPHVTVLNKADTEKQVEECLIDVEKELEGLPRDAGKSGQVKGRAIGIEM